MTLVLTLALHLPAAAFAPGGPSHQGVEPQRLQVVHPRVQAELSASERWQAFLAVEGDGWEVTWDEALGRPRRIRGPGVPMPADERAIGDAVIRWVERHAALLGIEPNGVQVARIGRSEARDTWYVDLAAPIAGLPVWRGGLTARIKHGRLIDLGVATYQGVPITGAHAIPSAQAIERAITAGPAPGATHTDTSAEAILLPIPSLSGLELRRVWLVRSATATPPGRWVSFVDGETGALRSVHNEVRFFDGQVLGEHDLRNPHDGTIVVSPMPEVEVVATSGEVATADELGAFSLLDDPGELVTDLRGGYARITNDAGPEGVLAGPGPDLLWTAADATRAEIDTYVFLHQVREWGRSVDPSVVMVQGPVAGIVNLPYTCNAYFDGNVNFFVEGQGCNNTGRIADVVYHEWGHGFHYWSLESMWTGFDGSLSEGAADTVAFLITGDPTIGPGFFTNGAGIRSVANDARYPEDFVPIAEYVHSNGLIFGGAMWDLWNLLRAEEGDEVGTDSTEAIFAGLLAGGPDIPGAFDEAVVADDDNGDLADGTPHLCALLEAFGAHGLGPLGGSGSPYLATHTPPPILPADVDHDLRFDLVSVAPTCFPYDPVAGTLHYRVDDGGWQTVAVSIDDLGVDATLPAQAAGSLVEYWVEVDDASGAAFQAPTGGAIHPYTAYVGGALEVWCHDFEADDGGFNHRLLDGDDDEGADDWQWGVPNGQSGDPSSARSGEKVWGNDLGHDNFNGAYQNEKHNRLRSPPLSTGHYGGVFLQYGRWLGVEDGAWDSAWIEADGEVVWSNHASSQDPGDEHHLDDQWMTHTVGLGAATEDGEVQLAWHLLSDQALSFGGWTIDDVCLLAPDTPDNRLGISDFDAELANGAVTLTWTHPKHEPVTEVVVVRRTDRFPTGVGDGEVVHRDDAPVAGAAAQAVHTIRPGGYYAVYASDGSRWLSWTHEGWNADAVGGLADGTVAGDEDRGAPGCGCATAPPTAGWLAFGLLLPLLRRRR